MKFLIDLLPVIVFFSLYKFFGLYVATAATAVTAVIQTLFYWFKNKKIDYLMLGSSALIVILASITLLLKDDIFIKWKPTAICWLFGAALLASQLIGKKPLIQRTLEAALKRESSQDLQLPDYAWRRLNSFWWLFYFLLGFINLYVIYHYDTDTWVNFKLFGMLGLNIVFVIVQTLYLSFLLKRHEHTTN